MRLTRVSLAVDRVDHHRVQLIIFILLFAGFWAERFTLFQNVVTFFASVVTAIGLLAVMWAAYGMRWVR